MNNELFTHIKNTISCSLTSENVFDKFIMLCQDYYEKPCHSLQEMKQMKSTKLKGDIFEHFCYLYVKHVMKIDEVWFLADLPNDIRTLLKLGKSDLGIDLIAKNNNKYIAIQVKYRKQTKKNTLIGWKELSTFFALVYRTGPFEKHIVFTNVNGIRHVGEKMDKDKSICIGSLRKIKQEEWLNMIGSIGQKINYINDTHTMTVDDLRQKRLAYFDNQH
jgi:hypothetical protein